MAVPGLRRPAQSSGPAGSTGNAAAGGSVEPGRRTRSRLTLADLLDLACPAPLRRIFATLIVLSAASFVVNEGTAASFVATVRSPNNTFSTGSLALTTSAGASSLFSISGMLPGDTVAAVIDLQNTGDLAATGYTMTTTVDTPGPLTADATNGLQLEVDRCSNAWTAPPPYTCSGTLTRSVVAGPLLQTGAGMGSTLPAGATDHLRIVVALPTSATNGLSGQTAVITFRWDISQ